MNKTLNAKKRQKTKENKKKEEDETGREEGITQKDIRQRVDYRFGIRSKL